MRLVSSLLARPPLAYAIVTVIVLIPVLSPGYILTGDMIFAPRMSFGPQFYGTNSSTWASLPYLLVLQLLSATMPAWVVQKLALFTVLWLAGFGAHRLIGKPAMAAYFGGLLYMLNPYVALRLLLGQWTLLAVVAVMPFAVSAMLEFLRSRSLVAAIKVAMLWTIAGMFQLHGFVLVGIVYFVIGMSALLRARNPSQLLRGVGGGMVVGGSSFLLLNAYWLIGSISGGFGRITRIPAEAIDAFVSRSSLGLPIGFEIGAMGGFWSASSLIPHPVIQTWYLAFPIVLTLAIYGFWTSRMLWARGDLVVLWAMGFVFAVGAGSAVTKPIYDFAWNLVPGFQGFRESHKFVMYIALVYSYLSAFGIATIMDRLRRSRSARIDIRARPVGSSNRLVGVSGHVGVLLIVWVVLFAYGISFVGVVNRMHPTDYPEAWYQAKKMIEAQEEPGTLLVFPWHQFMKFEWIEHDDRKVSNPARLFFGVNTIQADNIELPNYYSDSADPVSLYIEEILDDRNRRSDIGNELVPLNVDFVLLLKEEDYQSYSFLNANAGLRVVLNNERLTLFKMIRPTSAVLGVSVKPGQLMSGSRIAFTKPSSVVSPIDAVHPNLAEVRHSATEYEFVALPLAQGSGSVDWTHNGDAPVGFYLDFIPVFRAASGPGVFVYEQFMNRVIWGYGVSLVAMLIGLGLIGHERISGRAWPRT